jgi:hypothetical protein
MGAITADTTGLSGQGCSELRPANIENAAWARPKENDHAYGDGCRPDPDVVSVAQSVPILAAREPQ